MKTNMFKTFLATITALSTAASPLMAAPGFVHRGSRLYDQFAQVDAPKPPADAPAAPAPAPADAELRATIVAVKGNVQVQQADGQAWKPTKAGDVLGAGSSIRTGLNSAVQLKIDPGHTVTIDRFSVVKLLTLAKQQGGLKTDVGMKYGRTRYDVEAAGEVHDAKIHTPGTTLAIRGTSTGTQTDAFTESTWVIKGAVDNTNKLRREMVRVDASTGKAMVTSDLVTPSAFAKKQTKNDAKGEFAGRQQGEDLVVEQHASGELDDRQNGVEGFQDMARREGFQFAAVGVFGDVFDLDVFWSPAFNNSDIDVVISDPLGGLLDPKSNSIVRAGQSTQGQLTAIDDVGDIGGGFESANFGPQVPVGDFLVTIRHVSGDQASGFFDGRLNSGIFGTEFFDVDSNNPEAQFLVNPKNQTITPLGVGSGGGGYGGGE